MIHPKLRRRKNDKDKSTTMITKVVISLSLLVSSVLTGPSCASVTDEASHVCTQFKAPNADTPSDIAQEWRDADAALWNYVEESVPAVMDHTGTAAFDEHLKGVQAVLRYWGAPTYLTNAGLFHSIYGTEGFQGFALPLQERAAIQGLIGPMAENLSFWFCMVDRSTLDQTVFDWEGPVQNPAQKFHLRARPELGRFDLILSKDEWLDFIELTLADWLEQVEGASSKLSDLFLWKTGEAYAYRRLAYGKMSEILSVERAPRLSTIPKQMLEAVMGTEASETRHLVQARTPPMSAASAVALDALRSIGEAIPEDLSPQSLETQACEM
jgi:hypothetical protein